MRMMTFAAAAALTIAPAMIVAVDSAEAQRGRDGWTREWRGRDGRTYCRKNDGTTGLLIGGAAGVLAGRAIDTRGDRTLGTVGGAVAGALLGREVERRSDNRRCR